MRSGTTSRPPVRSWSCQARGSDSTLAVTIMASNGAAPGAPSRPSPTTTVAGDPAFRRLRRASAATSGSSSTDVTAPPSPTMWASSAALYPVPAPISATRSPGAGASSSSISAMIAGCDDDDVASPVSGSRRVTIASSLYTASSPWLSA